MITTLPDGTAIHYTDSGGTNPAIILLHGGLVTGELMWSAHLPTLSSHYRVIVPDTRGHGLSDNPAGHFAYDLFADDCAALITELGLNRPAVVGYSDGAQIALELGLRKPELVSALVLGGVVVEQSEQYRDALAAIGFSTPGEVDIDLFERTIPGFLDVIKKLHGADYVPTFMANTSRLWLTLPTYTDQQLAGIPVPTLIITGDRDEDVLTQAPRLCRTIPNAELAVIPGADHAAVERPLFADITIDFLTRSGKPTETP
ncbi:putative hydrolase (alpha/beta fold family) [Alloactinosynnema sp. L-07]|uniref:alpha/beta fold hydrolase n=1 Tax=Alloactinosynnema sp. L-07 TaxID=1653480 RepID=UPI00065F06BB|nr:alpha/beta hydrolase [Alloactinosynnema sp. L-07]CRK57313.1 putative hydrolase (alpha/beta fold family) [Alloactinosynnema sp. L-07]